MRIQTLRSLLLGTARNNTAARDTSVDEQARPAPLDVFLLAQRPQGGSGISKEEADGLKHDLEEIRKVARERQAKLDALEALRQKTAKHWLEVVQPQGMTYIARARALKSSASSPDKAERAAEARVELAEAERILNQASDWLAAQCNEGFADSGQALTLYGNLSTLVQQARAEVSSARAAIDLSEEQKKSSENLRLLNETLAALQARSNANDRAQRGLIESLTHSLEAGRRRQGELEVQSRAAEAARAAQHEETRRANAQMQQTMDEMAAAQMAARAGLFNRSVARREGGQSRSVSLRGPGLRRATVSEAARDIASRLVDALPTSLLARAASHALNDAEVGRAIESAGQASTDGDAAALLALYLGGSGEAAGVWAEPRRLAQQVLASLSALLHQQVRAHPPQDDSHQELWALRVRRNMTCGETPLGRSIDQCLAALRRAEKIVEAEAEMDSASDDNDFVDLGRAGPSVRREMPDASR